MFLHLLNSKAARVVPVRISQERGVEVSRPRYSVVQLCLDFMRVGMHSSALSFLLTLALPVLKSFPKFKADLFRTYENFSVAICHR